MNWQNNLIIEIIGPAGAGKTTIHKELTNKVPRIHGATFPQVWKLAYFPFFLKNILQILPSIFFSMKNTERNLSRREIAWMAILNGWFQLLNKNQRKISEIIVLDQGPIFLMTILKGFGPDILKQSYLESWWKKIYFHWSQTLNLVIWLDTSDETLIQRINARVSDHIIKGKTGQEVNEFITIFRSNFDYIMENMIKNDPKIRMIKINTGKISIDQVVDQVVSEVNLISEECIQR